MAGRVDLVLRAQAISERLQRVAAAGGKATVAAFLGEGLGGGRANAFGGAGDENALAAQMQVHGEYSLAWIKGREELGGRHSGGQHCTAALISTPVWSIAGPSNKPLER